MENRRIDLSHINPLNTRVRLGSGRAIEKIFELGSGWIGSQNIDRFRTLRKTDSISRWDNDCVTLNIERARIDPSKKMLNYRKNFLWSAKNYLWARVGSDRIGSSCARVRSGRVQLCSGQVGSGHKKLTHVGLCWIPPRIQCECSVTKWSYNHLRFHADDQSKSINW
jgi:hypothetical protein